MRLVLSCFLAAIVAGCASPHSYYTSTGVSYRHDIGNVPAVSSLGVTLTPDSITLRPWLRLAR